MGPDEKDTGPLTVYMDGQPVGIAGGEIPEISLAEDRGTAGGRATAGTVRQGPRTRVGRLGK